MDEKDKIIPKKIKIELIRLKIKNVTGGYITGGKYYTCWNTSGKVECAFEYINHKWELLNKYKPI